jgi:integrase
MSRLLETLRNEPMYPLIKVTATYGLRRSEVLGLKWDSVDFSENTLLIKHTVVQFKERVEKDKTKIASSHRTFPLVLDIRALLLELKAKEAANREEFGSCFIENDYIFKWQDGKPYSPDSVTAKFAQLLKRHGFPHIRFHELRHSCASILIAKGFSLKDVQEWLGHSNIQMTANIYSHIDTTRKQLIADAMAKTLA